MRLLLPFFLVATLIASSALASGALVGTAVPEFTLEDQFERQWTSNLFRGTTTVYVLSDRSGYEYSTNWTNVLIPRFRSSPVRFIPVADVQSVPGFLKGLIRSKFRDEFKYSVLMDWDGVLINGFSVQEGYTNLVIANKNGIIQHFTYGTGTSAQVEAFSQRLSAVLAAR